MNCQPAILKIFYIFQIVATQDIAFMRRSVQYLEHTYLLAGTWRAANHLRR